FGGQSRRCHPRISRGISDLPESGYSRKDPSAPEQKPRIMKRQYFYASLFVRVAKGLAVLTGLIGIGFCALRYYQASTAAGAVAYQPSPDLQQVLNRLKDAFLTAEQTANPFNEGNQSTVPSVDAPHFP